MVLSRTVRHVGNSDTAVSEFLEIENQIDRSLVFGWLSGRSAIVFTNSICKLHLSKLLMTDTTDS
jgi:hypothetical protein